MAVNTLSPYQLAIQNAAGRGAGAVADSATLGRIADSVFGPAPVPPGSRIIYQDAATVRWIDAEGYEHSASRSLDGRDPSAGQWRTQTNRPNVLPVQTSAGFNADLEALRAFAARQQQAPQLAQLDPQALAQFQAISQAEQARNEQQIAQQQAQIIASLFGNRVNESSIATGAGSQFAEVAQRIRQQQAADAAMRELQARFGLSQQGSQQSAQARQGLSAAIEAGLNLTGQQTQRAIAGGNLGLGYSELAERARQANQQFELGQQQADVQLAEQRSALNKVLKATQIAANIASLAGGGISAYGALTGGSGGGIPMPRGIGPILTPPYNAPYIPR